MLLVQSRAARIQLKAVFSFYYYLKLKLRNRNRKGMGGSLMHLKLLPGSSIPLASAEYVFSSRMLTRGFVLLYIFPLGDT